MSSTPNTDRMRVILEEQIKKDRRRLWFNPQTEEIEEVFLTETELRQDPLLLKRMGLEGVPAMAQATKEILEQQVQSETTDGGDVSGMTTDGGDVSGVSGQEEGDATHMD